MYQDFDPGESKENAFGNRYYPCINGNLFEKTEASVVFGRYYKESFNQPDFLYIIAGTDSALLPFYIAEKFKSERKGRKFIFIEYKPVFNGIDISGLPDWVEVYPEDFPVGILSQKEVEYMASNKVTLKRSISVIDSDYEDPYGQLWVHVEDEYHKLMFAENVSSASRSFVDAQLLNIHANIRPVKLLKGKLKDRDVLMLGGGPSLDDSIDWIKENADKFIIFAAARISARLLNEGIKPDIVTSVDPHDLSFDNSKHMLQFGEGVVLLNCHHINPKLLNQWPHNAVYFGDSLPWGEPEENSSSPGPTVIHSAVHQAVFMGAKNIFLSGVDLCFKGNQTHSSGSAESHVGKLGFKRLTQVETYAGEMADTDQAFSSGVEALSWLVKGYEQIAPDCTIYNLSEHAAKVKGIAFKKIDSIAVESLEPKAKLLDEINELLSVDAKEMRKHLKRSLKAFQEKRLILNEAIEVTDKGLKLTEDYVEGSTETEKLVKTKAKLDKTLGDLNEVLYHYGIEYFRDAFRPVEDESHMSVDEIKLTLRAYFTGMSKSAKDFKKQLEKSIEVLKRRNKEFKEGTTLLEMTPLWKENFEPGRFQIWQKYHQNDNKSEDDQFLIEELSQILEDNIAQTDTKQAKLIKDRSESPVELHNKALKAYEKHNVNDLQGIAEKLNASEKFEGVQLRLLINGMVEELQGNIDSAIQMYQEIKFKPFRFFTLKRLLEYAMKNEQHNDSLAYLEELCGYSLDYLLPYSDYLALIGQYGFAHEVLSVYVQKFPDHLMAWLKLAELAIKMGSKDAAVNALEAAEKLDPQNPQILQLMQILKP